MVDLTKSSTYSDINGNLYSITDTWNFTDSDDIEMGSKAGIIFSYFYRYMTFNSDSEYS